MQIVGERYTTAKSFSCHGYGSVIKLKDKQLDKLEFDIDFFVSSAIIYPVNIVKAMKSDSRYLEVLQRVP